MIVCGEQICRLTNEFGYLHIINVLSYYWDSLQTSYHSVCWLKYSYLCLWKNLGCHCRYRWQGLIICILHIYWEHHTCKIAFHKDSYRSFICDLIRCGYLIWSKNYHMLILSIFFLFNLHAFPTVKPVYFLCIC